MGNPKTLFNVISNNHDAFNPGYLRSNIVVSGTDESLIYIGGIEHGVRNEDIGDEFGILNPFQRIDTYYWHSGLQRKSIIDQNKYVHDDIRDLEIFSSEEADTIYIANDGGIRKAWTVGDTSITVNGYYLGIWKLYDNIDLRDWKPGTYIISLVSNGKTVQSEKFTKF